MDKWFGKKDPLAGLSPEQRKNLEDSQKKEGTELMNKVNQPADALGQEMEQGLKKAGKKKQEDIDSSRQEMDKTNERIARRQDQIDRLKGE